MQIVWLKRDLRVRDHRPLYEAAKSGETTLVLFVYEPELVDSPEMHSTDLAFQDQCLAELEEALAERGVPLTYRVGPMPDVLDALHREAPFGRLLSHRETGNRLTYDRDLRVKSWCSERGVEWRELGQHGVVRRLRTRDGWASRWERKMRQPLLPSPEALTPMTGIDHERRRSPKELGHTESVRPGHQPGGEQEAWDRLDSFLDVRGVGYRSEMSSPLGGWESCSRLSPHLAYGSISLRSVFHATTKQALRVKRRRKEGRDIDPRWSDSLESFGSRLRWHCHFIQKLEDQPSLEFENMNRAFDGMRPDEPDEERLQRWREGQTGFPMIDACMRALLATGWLNFRMRAMLISFASYQLWLHWRAPATHLAHAFLDFEPGIHFSQVQMQAGVTGINAIRIYSPAKQVADQDPKGEFIRRWCPELESVPDSFIAEPHKMPTALQRKSGCRIGADYPKPVVDPLASYRRAKDTIFAWRKRAGVREKAGAVFQRHGSRKGPMTSRRRRRQP